MEISMILIPAAILAALGAFFGILLAVASRVFAVKVDERVPKVRDLLPGANCGGCGYSGCDALATAIVEGTAPCNACTVGGTEVAQAIAGIMGTTAGECKRMRAQVMCSGTNGEALKKYLYEGPLDCLVASRLAGGDKLCNYGCLGLGSCASACKFDAILIKNGVAAVVTHAEDVPYFDYVRAIKQNPVAKQVKLADLAHNSDSSRMTGTDVQPEKLAKRLEKYRRAREILLEGDDA